MSVNSGEYERGLQAAWDEINKQILHGHLKEPQHSERNGLVRAANSIMSLIDECKNPLNRAKIAYPSLRH